MKYPSLRRTVLQLESKSFWFVSIVYLPAQSQYKYYSSCKHLAWNTSLSPLNHLILHLLKPLLEIHNILDFWACTTKTRMQLQFPLLARHSVGTKVSGSAGAPGTTGKMNELSQEAQSKPVAAGNAWCNEKRIPGEETLFIRHQTTALGGDMDNLSISLKFKPGQCSQKEQGKLRHTKTLYLEPQLQKPNFPNSNSFLLSG